MLECQQNKEKCGKINIQPLFSSFTPPLDDQNNNINVKLDIKNDQNDNDDKKQNKEKKLSFDPKTTEPYAGMPAEMVRYYSEQPLYRGLRYFLLFALLATMVTLATLAGVTVSRSAPCLESWQEAPIYQVYPLSFYDSDGDGVGDLKGIQEKIDYIEELGVGSIWLNPIYDSPQRDMGYDISDYRKIWPTFGTMEDFQNMLDTIHKKGLKLIMDFVPNHSSDQHEWFLASSDPSHPDFEKYKDYYVWKDRTPTENVSAECLAINPDYDYPNNWVSVFSGSAWTWHEKRGMYYLHQFLPEQPDFNLENYLVVQELIDVLDFWLEKGVDGFRMDAVQYSYEAQHFRDEYATDPSISKYCVTEDSDTNDLHHDFTKEQPGMHDMLQAFRDKCKEYSQEPGVDIVMITEAYQFDPQKISRYYGTNSEEESSFPFNFFMIAYGAETEFNSDPNQNSGKSGWSAEFFAHNIIDTWLAAPQQTNSNYKAREWPNWVVSNHDNPRMATKTNREFSEAIAVMLLTLPGTQTLYYGDEIGMIDVPTTEDTDEGGNDRGPCRAPMQWDNSTWAGFTTNTDGPWLPVDTSVYPGIVQEINVADQENDKNSMLMHYKSLIKMNKDNLQLHRGHYCNFNQGVSIETSPLENNVLSYIREQNGLKTGFIAMFNFDRNEKSISIQEKDFGQIINLDDREDEDNKTNQGIFKDALTTIDEKSDGIYDIKLGSYGYLVAEYKILGEYYFEREGAVCYVSREIEMKGDIPYKV